MVVLKPYKITYSGCGQVISDLIFAESRVDAAKRFVITHKGTVYVHKVEEMKIACSNLCTEVDGES